MNFGSSTVLRDFIDRHEFIHVQIAAALLGIEDSSAARHLARLVEAGELETAGYVGRRLYWHPYKPLGAQALMMRAPVACFCAYSEERWEMQGWDGPAAIVTSGEQKEAVFLDLLGSVDHVGRKLRDYEKTRITDSFTRFTVLVPTGLRGDKVSASLHRRKLPVPFRCVTVHDLMELLFHEKRKHPKRRSAEPQPV